MSNTKIEDVLSKEMHISFYRTQHAHLYRAKRPQVSRKITIS